MPRRTVVSPYQLSLWEESEIERCAAHIRADLGLEGLEETPDLDTVLYLVERHGGEPEPAKAVGDGENFGECIRVNPALPLSALSLVLFHEHIHRLCHGERYIELNPVQTQLPRRIWLEILAGRIAH